MFGPGKRWLGAVTAVGLVAGCAADVFVRG